MRTIVLFSGLLLVAGCSATLSTTPVPISENAVYCPPLQWTVTKPSEWSFIGLSEVRAAQRQVRTTNQFFNMVVYQGNAAPFVTIVRNEEPSAVVSISRLDLGEERLASNERIAGLILGTYVHVVTGAQPVGPIVNVKVAGQTFARARIRYVLHGEENAVTEVERIIWVRRIGHSAVTISAAFDPQASLTMESEVSSIIAGIVPGARPI